MSVEPKQKVRYNYEFLKKYCEENNIVLLKDYSNEKVNRDTKIEGNCISENCNNTFNKSFRNLINTNGDGGEWSILNYFDTNPGVRNSIMGMYNKPIILSALMLQS